MPAPISVVIPTLNAANELSDTLACLVEGIEAGLLRELIVSDGGSQDETVDIAEAWGATVITDTAGRGGQLARGCQAAKGDWLLILHADSHLAPGWRAVVRQHLAGSDAAYFRLVFRAKGLAPRLVAGWANLRARVLGLPYGDQSLLLPRALYDDSGGYANIPLMEDVAMARALKGKLVMLDHAISTSAARYQRQGWLRRGARNLWLLLRYLAGADPEKLADEYRSAR
ncbi:TIGR04283 family arsenosugar biosynthesis glycosyltransferase [Pseudaestuariivita rosea]|uniref:TIGR04283 family arsenosugar biosynthesis glycosyltransferase n=1 Tax=Pseudaestuariivita rosea TaxID=2763263 RepID=UPI001ABB2700|nr:TIGR04283 family arsenosugar biosynthesis glycosyltransferase [Pseudaestuariivita rosea]